MDLNIRYLAPEEILKLGHKGDEVTTEWKQVEQQNVNNPAIHAVVWVLLRN
jgi:hypothetical protein